MTTPPPTPATTTSATTTPAGRTQARRRVVVPLLVAVLAGVVALALLIPGADGGGQVSTPPAAGPGEEPAAGPLPEDPAPDTSVEEARAVLEEYHARIVRRDADDPTALGAVDAPVVMVSWSDYRCPYCGSFARDTEPELVERFVDAGVLRIEWRDFAYLSEESRIAARAARAAGEQGMFWEFHDAVFADQASGAPGALDEEHVLVLAEQLGLDLDRFAEDLASERVAALVEADMQEGLTLGVSGTPAFLINGEPVVGAQPTEVFVDVIERAAARAGADG